MCVLSEASAIGRQEEQRETSKHARRWLAKNNGSIREPEAKASFHI